MAHIWKGYLVTDRVVITGVNGFVGKHLVEELALRSDYDEIIGIGREAEPNKTISQYLHEYYACDLSLDWPAISKSRTIIHLAGLSAVGPSFNSPQKYINLNSSMVTYMCESIMRAESRPRLLLVSSGSVYNNMQEMPINESGQLDFTSPYSVSKALNEIQAKYYRKKGLEIIVVRPFNHIGPGQSNGFIVPDLLGKITSGNSDKILVGNLKNQRDYTDVRDVVRAYRTLAEQPSLQHDTYNVCSGKSVSGEEILDTILDITNREKPELVIDKSKLRPNDPPEIRGDYSRLYKDTGWEPSVNLKQTIEDIVKELMH